MELAQIVRDFARGMELADARRPQAVNVRTKQPYSSGIGPHTEAQTMGLAFGAISIVRASTYSGRIQFEVPYISRPRSKCDVCLGAPPEWDWAIEIKMLRMMGDNGKPNDNILMHILSPYPTHRSAVTDCEKLVRSGLKGRKGILIFGYDYDDLPMDPAVESFELLASQLVRLSDRATAGVEGLVHPIHRRGRVFGWEIEKRIDD